jgi:PIN domain nuclease of toxin-antitoxin system
VKVLVDTHAVIWWLEDAPRLSKRASAILENRDNDIVVSAIVGWEIAIKISSGKMQAGSIIESLARLLQREFFSELPITLDAAIRSGFLPLYHRDPFDRVLVAQALSLNVPIVSADAVLDRYDIKRLW